MPKTTTKQHVCKLKLVTGKWTPVWRCMTGYCSYTLYRAQEHFLVGKATICWNCGNEFRIDTTDIDRVASNPEEEAFICYGCRSISFIEAVDRMERADIHKMMEDARKTDLDIEIEKLRNELTGDIDDDIVRQIAEQNLRDRANKTS